MRYCNISWTVYDVRTTLKFDEGKSVYTWNEIYLTNFKYPKTNIQVLVNFIHDWRWYRLAAQCTYKPNICERWELVG